MAKARNGGKRPTGRAAAGRAAAAREVAFATLKRLEQSSGTHADELLRGVAMDALSEQDRDLTTALVMGVLRWQILLDKRIQKHLARPDAKLDLPVRIALRMGAFQLLLLDRIPDHAAISESVTLCRAAGHEHASRMVNAVLRKIAAEDRAMPNAAAARDARELAEATAHPEWLVERWVRCFGMEQARRICQHGQRQPEISVRVVGDGADKELREAGVALEEGRVLRCARRLTQGDLSATRAWASGWARIQDEGSQLVAELAGAGERILDCCAAPGGKTMILAERNPVVRIDACEVNPARAEAMRARLAALPWAGRIQVHGADAVEWMAGHERGAWDLVLVDAPCSGTGTLGRNPEIRHRLRAEDFLRHAQRQTALLEAAMQASSRRVVYSTCSLEPEENQAVVAAALAECREWRQISLDGSITRLQQAGHLSDDGAEWLREGLLYDGSLGLMTRAMRGAESTAEPVRMDGFFVVELERCG